MTNAIVIYGPQGCGKTMNAPRIAKHFGLTQILEDEGSRSQGQFPEDTLVLTNNSAVAGALDFFQVMAQINEKGKNTARKSPNDI